MPRRPRPHDRHPLLADAREAVLLDYLQLRARRPENQDRDAIRGLKAMALAPDLHLCRALLRGERVHWSRLDPLQAERYGIRYGSRRHDGRYVLDDFNDVRR